MAVRQVVGWTADYLAYVAHGFHKFTIPCGPVPRSFAVSQDTGVQPVDGQPTQIVRCRQSHSEQVFGSTAQTANLSYATH